MDDDESTRPASPPIVSSPCASARRRRRHHASTSSRICVSFPLLSSWWGGWRRWYGLSSSREEENKEEEDEAEGDREDIENVVVSCDGGETARGWASPSILEASKEDEDEEREDDDAVHFSTRSNTERCVSAGHRPRPRPRRRRWFRLFSPLRHAASSPLSSASGEKKSEEGSGDFSRLSHNARREDETCVEVMTRCEANISAGSV